MAAALLARHLSDLGVEAAVQSAGRGPAGVPPPARVVETMAGSGLDCATHRSQVTVPAMVASSDVVIGMAREHVRDALDLDPGARPRAFTLKELVRRGEEVGPRAAHEDVGAWLRRLDATRGATDLLGVSSRDDVADPIGGSKRTYRTTAKELDDLTGRLARLLA